MRYLITGFAFALFSVLLIWFSGAAQSADDLDELFGEKQSEVDPFAADDDAFGDDGQAEDDPFGDAEPSGDDLFGDDDPFGGIEVQTDDELAQRGRSRGRRNDRGDSRQAPQNAVASKKIAVGAKSKAEITIRTELDKISPPIDFADTSLTDVITILRENHEDINIVLDEAALDIAGVDPETPINKTLNGVKLRNVLRLTLKGLDLTYVIKNEVLLITTVEEAEQLLATEVYPVHDMLNKQDLNKSANSLMDTITSNVSPENWEEVGGTGAVSFYQGNLIISQTSEVHEGVVILLEKLRAGIKIVGGPIYPETVKRANSNMGGLGAAVANKGAAGGGYGGGGYGGEGDGYGADGGYGGGAEGGGGDGAEGDEGYGGGDEGGGYGGAGGYGGGRRSRR